MSKGGELGRYKSRSPVQDGGNEKKNAPPVLENDDGVAAVDGVAVVESRIVNWKTTCVGEELHMEFDWMFTLLSFRLATEKVMLSNPTNYIMKMVA